MQIQILYFARFREKLGRDSETFELAADRDTSVQTVLDVLAARGGIWQELFDCEKGVLSAINQEMVSRETLVYDEDELALFPPVTGG